MKDTLAIILAILLIISLSAVAVTLIVMFYATVLAFICAPFVLAWKFLVWLF